MNDPGQSDYRAGALVAVLCYVYKRRVFHVGHQLLLPGFLSLDILHNGLTDAPLLPPAYLILLSTEEVMFMARHSQRVLTMIRSAPGG